MKRVYSSPTIDGIYVINYTGAHVRRKKDALNQVQGSIGNNSTIEGAGKEWYQQGFSNAMKDIETAKKESYREGMRDGCKQVEDKLCTVFQAIQDAAKRLQLDKCNIWQKSETEIIKLVFAVAQKVVGYEVANNNNLIEKVVAETILQAGKHKIASIRMNPADVTRLKDSKITIDSDSSFEIVEDKKISPGGCIVEIDFGCIDAQLETRMNRIMDQMLAHQESEGQGSSNKLGTES